MNKKQQKQEMRQRQSTRQLMGVRELTDHGASTPDGEFIFYLIRPDNLSVMPEETIRNRVLSLTNLLRSSTELVMVALDSRESFQSNKAHYQKRSEDEPLPAVRELLRRDSAHLDAIQTGTASSREFALLVRPDSKLSMDRNQLAQIEKRIHGCGFTVRLANRQDIKRILAVYYQQDAFTEDFKDYDGEGMVTDNENAEEENN